MLKNNDIKEKIFSKIALLLKENSQYFKEVKLAPEFSHRSILVNP